MTWTAVTTFYVATVLFMLAPLENYSAFSSAIAPGDPKLLAWTFAWTNHAILTWTSLFNANVFYPARPALAFIEHHVGVGIWGLPLFAVTGNAILVYSVLKVLGLVLNGIAMHVFVWRWLRSHAAAVVGGLILAVSASRLLYCGHVPLVWNCWLPLLLVSLDRWMTLREWKWIGISALLFSLQALATWYLGVMAAILVVVFVAWRAVWGVVWQPREPQEAAIPRRRSPLALAPQASAAVLLVALVLWPFARPYLALQEQEELTADLTRRYAADWGSYIQPHENALMGPFITRVTGLPTRRVSAERAQFLGILTMFLATVGAIRWALLAFARRRRGDVDRSVLWAGCFLLVGAVAIALSFGASGGAAQWRLFDLFLKTPGLNLFRVPARFSVLVTLAVAGLAGFGLAGMRQAGRRAGLVSLALIPAMLLEWAVVPPAGSTPSPDVTPRIYDLVASLDVHALVSLPCYRRTHSTWPLDADYMLYSTRHWRPIVNGYGRAEPHALVRVLGAVNAFPGANAATRMRALGIDYVVVHTARFPDHAVALLEHARASEDFRLVAGMDGDYLFHLLPTR